MAHNGPKFTAQPADPVRPYHFPTLAKAKATSGSPDLQQAWQQGYDQGFEQGQQDGLREGREAGYNAGHQQGLDDGLKQGLKQGDQKGRARFEQGMIPLTAILERLGQWEQTQLPMQRALLLQLVSRVAQLVVQRELRQRPDTLLPLIEQVLESLPEQKGPLTIWLHPDDVAALAEVGVTRCGEWPIRDDGGLQRGDCRIDTPDSTIESLCAERLQQAMDHVALFLAEVADA